MAIWHGWMSGSCLLDISTCTGLDHSLDRYFHGEVFNYHQISLKRFLFQLEKCAVHNLGLLDLLAYLQRGTFARMVEIWPWGGTLDIFG